MLVADDLPPFATLTTDEERERKAVTTNPGTYNVVVNPESFQHLPEYSDDSDTKSLRTSPLRRGSLAASMASSQGRETLVDGAQEVEGMPHHSEDPNVVILHRFEDATRKATFQWKESRSSISPQISTSVAEVNAPIIDGHVEDDPTRSLMQIAAEGGQDSSLLHHFRNRIWRQLAQVQSESIPQASAHVKSSGVEVLERAARFFPPVSLQTFISNDFRRFAVSTIAGREAS